MEFFKTPPPIRGSTSVEGMMHYIRENVLAGQFVTGVWCNLSSSITTEIAASSGFDWILIDQEHGPGDNITLLGQLQAIGQRPCAPIVRIAWNELPRFKRALDLGASGIMVPFIETAQDARRAVSYLRYPPEGVRGTAASPRAAGFGTLFETYFSEANQNLLSVHQIETSKALQNLDEIAQVDGVDVLFVGPLDLSVSVGMHRRFEDEEFRKILSEVALCARKNGKAAGILLPNTQLIDMVYEMGFTFIAVGSDSGMVVEGMQKNVKALNRYKR